MVYLSKTFSQTKMMVVLSYRPFASIEIFPTSRVRVWFAKSHHSPSKGDKRKQKIPLCFATYCVTWSAKNSFCFFSRIFKKK